LIACLLIAYLVSDLFVMCKYVEELFKFVTLTSHGSFQHFLVRLIPTVHQAIFFRTLKIVVL
jgi:hypothetical protein